MEEDANGTEAVHIEYLTTAAAADRAGVHPQTLRRWEKTGQLPRQRRTPGGMRRYNSADLDKVLETVA